MPLNTRLVARSRAAWPREAGWLVPGTEYDTPGANCTWLEYLVVRRTGRDDGILEVPIGSNRGTRIDAMTERAGSPLGSWWCGIWVGAVWRDCGALVPGDYAAVDAWLPHLVRAPRPGSAVIYGPSGANGTHIGIVTRLGTGLKSRQGFELLTREGNRGYAGSATNNGITIDAAPLTRYDVLGFVRPQIVQGWTLEAHAPLEFLLEHWGALPAEVRERARPRFAGVIR